jgi:hypothetical protein
MSFSSLTRIGDMGPFTIAVAILDRVLDQSGGIKPASQIDAMEASGSLLTSVAEGDQMSFSGLTHVGDVGPFAMM